MNKYRISKAANKETKNKLTKNPQNTKELKSLTRLRASSWPWVDTPVEDRTRGWARCQRRDSYFVHSALKMANLSLRIRGGVGELWVCRELRCLCGKWEGCLRMHTWCKQEREMWGKQERGRGQPQAKYYKTEGTKKVKSVWHLHALSLSFTVCFISYCCCSCKVATPDNPWTL